MQKRRSWRPSCARRTAAVCAVLSGLLLLVIGFGGVFGLVAAAIVVRAGLYNMIVPLYRAWLDPDWKR